MVISSVWYSSGGAVMRAMKSVSGLGCPDARQLLDELMGRTRDMDPQENLSGECDWTEPKFCRYFLVKFCPHQLFTNTKADMGPCFKIHDDFVKRRYELEASPSDRISFEDEFIRFCQQTLSDVERRIKRAKQRLAGSQKEREEDTQLNGLLFPPEIQEKMSALSERMEHLLEQIEVLGSDGRVDEAQEAMRQVDKLKEESNALRKEHMGAHWIQQRAEMGAAQEKQMEVCDVCGAFLIVNDVQQRVDDHLMGKQHVGFGKLKLAIDEILEKRKNKPIDEPKPTSASQQPKSGSSRTSGSSRDSNGSRSHHRNSHRDQERKSHRSEDNSNKSSSSSSGSHRRHQSRSSSREYDRRRNDDSRRDSNRRRSRSRDKDNRRRGDDRR